MVPHLLVSSSVTPTVTSSDRRPLSQQRAFTRVPLYMQERKLSLRSAISSLSRHVRKVPLFATLRRNLATAVHSHVPRGTMPPSLATLPMTTKHASVSHLAQRRPSLAVHAPLSASLLAVGVLTSRCSKLAEHITNTRPNVTSIAVYHSSISLVLTDLQLASYPWCRNEPRGPSPWWW